MSAEHKGEQTGRLQEIDQVIKQYVATQLCGAAAIAGVTDPDAYMAGQQEATSHLTPLLAQICRLGHEITEAAHAGHDEH